MLVTVLVIAAAVWTGSCVLAWSRVRSHVRRSVSSEDERSERVHRLRRLSVWLSFGSLTAVVVSFGAVGGASGALRHDSTGAKIAGLTATSVAALATLVTMFAAGRTVRRGIATVRGTDTRSPLRRRQLALLVVSMIVFVALIESGYALVPRHGVGHVIGRGVAYFVALTIFSSVLAPLMVVRMRTRPVDEGLQVRLDGLARQVGVRIRGFRVMAARGQKTANAMQTGTLPGLRYIVLTDYLVDHLDAVELDAVVAHELGHARKHHIALKLIAVAAVWAALQVLLVAVDRTHGVTGGLLVLPVAIAFPVGLLLVQGLVGVRLEEAADDVAAREVGAQHLADALDKVGALNDAKRDTGRVWAVLTQHPGLQARTARVRHGPTQLSTSG